MNDADFGILTHDLQADAHAVFLEAVRENELRTDAFKRGAYALALLAEAHVGRAVSPELMDALEYFGVVQEDGEDEGDES